MTAPRRIRIVLAYDGRPFAGWQSQPAGNTVQDILEAAAFSVAGGKGFAGPGTAGRVPMHGSGRTDAGVHALGQVAHFDPPAHSRLTPDDWRRALNATLPPTIRVLAAESVAPDFHARFSAVGKSYRYRIANGPVLSPFEHGLAWHIRGGLDLEAMQEALAVFEGTHDFRAFAANRRDGSDAKDGGDSVRTVHAARVHLEATTAESCGPMLRLEFHGTGFLYRMVRLLTGSAVRVAQGRSTFAWLSELLRESDAGRSAKSPFCAPAEGLCLMHVDYAAPPPPNSVAAP